MKQETKPQDTSTRKDELPGNICKHCGEPYTTQERNRVYGNNVLMSGYCSAGCYTEGTLNPAAPVKDELDITKGKWSFSFKEPHSEDGMRSPGGCTIQADTDKTIFGRPVKDSIAFMIHWYDDKDTNRIRSNAKAICTAVNETYGKGYNPAAMEELYKAATMALDNMENGEADTKYRYTTVVNALQTALTNAKTIKP